MYCHKRLTFKNIGFQPLTLLATYALAASYLINLYDNLYKILLVIIYYIIKNYNIIILDIIQVWTF